MAPPSLVLALLAYGCLFPLPLYCLLATFVQRRRLQDERRAYSTLKRIAKGHRF